MGPTSHEPVCMLIHYAVKQNSKEYKLIMSYIYNCTGGGCGSGGSVLRSPQPPRCIQLRPFTQEKHLNTVGKASAERRDL